MKKQYMKPTICVVKIQQQNIICSSYDQMDSLPVGKYKGSGIPDDDDDTLGDDDEIF